MRKKVQKRGEEKIRVTREGQKSGEREKIEEA